MTSLVEVIVDLDGADLAIVDALARLQLAARRTGASVRLRGASPRLTEVLELAGLSDVLPCSGMSGAEVGGQAEALEEPRVQEVVDVRDPAG